MKKYKILYSLAILLMIFQFSGIANAITLAERDELNNATPGTQKVGLGTKIRSILAEGQVTLGIGDTVVALSVEPAGDTGYVSKTTGTLGGGGDATALGDGSVGQIVTFALVTDGGAPWTITPDTASGFTDITFADAGDNATLQFKNTTIGWVVVGSADTSSGPVLSAP